MEKKVVLGLVGVLSAVGLGWMVSRLVKPTEEDGETPKLTVSMYWNLGGRRELFRARVNAHVEYGSL